jgi:catechol 2,3-dioxygenase-like lactoylglutathione lyase family enzyme
VEARKKMLRTDKAKVEELIPELTDIAIPILPSRSVNDTLAFFRRLGFDGKVWVEPYSYAILRRGTVELHFFTQDELRPAESSAGCYIRVSDVENIYQTFALARLPRKGIPRQDVLEDKPWGMREFAIVDPDGNLLRIGQPL